MRLQVLMFKQDDPKKCTAAKMVRLGIAKDVKNTTASSLILDPFAEKYLLPKDRTIVFSIVGIDCSWNLADQTFSKKFTGVKRKLPPLLAGNPVNYSKLNKLTTAEAMAAALFIMGYQKDAHDILNKFKWGHTFYELNRNLLEDYSKIKTEDEISSILTEYGLMRS